MTNTVSNPQSRMKLAEAIADSVGWTAYLACLEANKVKRRTRTLGLRRPTYDFEYGSAARAAVVEYLRGVLSDPACLRSIAAEGE